MKTRMTAWIAALLITSALGCQVTPPAAWAEMRVSDVTYNDLYSVVLTTLAGEGYGAAERDPENGTIKSDWFYGMSQAKYRGPARRRVVVEIDPEGDSQVIRLRVIEEVIRKAGLRATNVQDSDDWEIAEDNFEEAEFLLARIRGVMSTTIE